MLTSVRKKRYTHSNRVTKKPCDGNEIVKIILCVKHK